MCQDLVPLAEGIGQALVAEVLMLTPAIRNMIRDEKTHQIYSMIQTGTEHGMQTMNQSLLKLAKDRKITREMALSRSSDTIEMENLLRGK